MPSLTLCESMFNQMDVTFYMLVPAFSNNTAVIPAPSDPVQEILPNISGKTVDAERGLRQRDPISNYGPRWTIASYVTMSLELISEKYMTGNSPFLSLTQILESSRSLTFHSISGSCGIVCINVCTIACWGEIRAR